MKTLNEQIGERLREARVSAGFTLREVSDIVGKNHSTISTYETGTRAINVDFMEYLCKVYGVNYLDILNEIYYLNKNK